MLRGICAFLTVVALLLAICGCEARENHQDNAGVPASSMNG